MIKFLEDEKYLVNEKECKGTEVVEIIKNEGIRRKLETRMIWGLIIESDEFIHYTARRGDSIQLLDNLAITRL